MKSTVHPRDTCVTLMMIAIYLNAPGGIMPGGMPIGAGPPTPRTGAVKPVGGTKAPAPRPTGAALPGPPAAPAPTFLACDGGGASGVIELTLSPRSSNRPSIRFTSRSSPDPDLSLSFRNSSQSAITRFMWRSYARNCPTSCRPSCNVIRTR